MGVRGIELILMRQLASCLATPILLCDATGELVYVNEPAEELLGLSLEGPAGALTDHLIQRLGAREADGSALAPDSLPLCIALREARPASRCLRIKTTRGGDADVDTTAFPLVSPNGESVGVVSIFWTKPGAR